MSFGGHRVVPFTHAYRGPGIGAAFKGVAERTPTIGDANVAAWQHHVKMITNAFRTFDEDHSGYIGREELEHGIQHFNMTIPHEHVKQIVDQLDTDHDGKISYAEFARLLHSQEAQSVDIFGRSHTERNAVEDPILSFPDPNHVGNAHLHINRHPEMR